MRAHLRRWTAWLCLALALFAGSMPARAFVVCIEADGCVRIETTSGDGACEGCEGHERSERTEFTQPGAPSCPCFDLYVPGTNEPQLVVTRSVELAAPCPLPRRASIVLASEPVRALAPALVVPRPPAVIEHVRCVVLVV